MIHSLKDNEVFVFGSNLLGMHMGGAALYAKEHFGAEEGIGEGPTGKCYALPTLDKKMGQFNDEQLYLHILKFRKYAADHPELTFLLTRVGCGIAGYPEDYMKRHFSKIPANVVPPEEWKKSRGKK